MVLLFCLRDLEKEKAKKCLIAFDSLRTSDRYSVFGYTNVEKELGKKGVAPVSESLTFCSTSAPLITEGLKGNPRQVKRFLNAFTLRKRLAEVAKLQHIRDEVLVKLMVLEYGHPRQYQQLYEWQAAAEGFPREIQNLELVVSSFNEGIDGEEYPEIEKGIQENTPGWNTSFMQKWLAMEPKLSDVDLRDYFWVSRDRLQSTFSDISMVSPIVRRVFEDLLSSNAGKRNIAVNETVDLNDDETSSLLVLLEEHVYRHPEQRLGYDALRILIEANIEGAADTLVRVLDECPPRSIPPALAFPIKALIQKKSELKEVLQPAIDRLMETQSPIGSALKRRNPKV